MTSWPTVFLGMMAGALVLSTVMQLALIYVVVGAIRAMQAQLLTVEKQLTPLLGHVTVMAEHLEHSTKMASAKIERLDRLLNDASRGLSSARGALRAAVGSVSRASLATTVLKGVMAWRRRRATTSRSLPLGS